MIFDRPPILRIDLVGRAIPQLPGVGDLVELGVRHREYFEQPADHSVDLWGMDLAGITSSATPIVQFASPAYVTADGATVTGTPGLDFEGQPHTLDDLSCLVITVTGATVTATVSGTGLLARLPVGTHVFRGTLTEWQAPVTFAAPSGTAAISITALYL
jgi:hypothetical protein